ncbi:MAG TPA: heme exporter protein CcmD [Sedimenticola thiotaurini]|uniref:Heme exporter protein D n=1 Tax=Sedimenticola thiotaurini TaxID=1543721 RepID=A0A831W745_9GAMM|nr:heme exporter protein CcmD [Sedimenticola thiotaurini]
MNAGSLGEFFEMGGYALYVWGSFGATFLLMAVEPILVRRRHQAILQRIRRMIRLETEVKR